MSMKLLSSASALLCASTALPTHAENPLSYYHTLDTEIRMDGRTDREEKWQYRLRYYPTVNLTSDNSWSINGLITTGDSFANTRNSFDGNSHNLYMRRLFVRKSYDGGKTEVGILPTYKGRLSLTGLSYDGWIKGIRQVVKVDDDTAVEFVAGNLDDLDAANALDFPDEMNYYEFEYSSRVARRHHIELGLERMLSGNFTRAEYRYDLDNRHAATVEWVQRVDEAETKLTTGFTGQLPVAEYPVGYAAYYSYTSEHFGPRGTLTEDFIGTGHGFSVDCFSQISVLPNTSWFVGYDLIDATHRLQVGIRSRIH